jgi:alpha-L-rhamnosidase
MMSFNHYALGAVGKWLYRFLFGIDQEGAPPASATCCSGRNPGGRVSWAGTKSSHSGW